MFYLIFLPLFSLFANPVEQMSLEEKVGQLFICPVSPWRGEDHWRDWQNLLENCHVGGAILNGSFDADAGLACLDRLFAMKGDTPFIVAADAEWGLAMRIGRTVSFPRNLTLGAVQDLALIEQMGVWIGKQARLFGIGLNLAPVADVNSNPQNPIIHMRSFGERPEDVAVRVRAVIRGMRSQGLLTCAKHFPGHGDTAVDSHRELPVLRHSGERLRNVEWVPFRAAIEEGVDAVMSAHLLVPALDDVPSSLSKRFITDFLRGELGFQGLAVTDGLNMKALSEARTPEEIVLGAYEAGHDLLLFGAHLDPKVDELLKSAIPRAYQAMLQAFQLGRFSIEELDRRVLRILEAKSRVAKPPHGPAEFLQTEALQLRRKLYRQAVTLLGSLPPHLLNGKTAYVAIGGAPDEPILSLLRERGVSARTVPLRLDAFEACALAWQLDGAEKLIVGLHAAVMSHPTFGLSFEAIKLGKSADLLISFCTPYVLRHFTSAPSILAAYEADPDAQRAVFDCLSGLLKPTGQLPITIDY